MSGTGHHLVVFDHQLARHYDIDGQRRLSERPSEGLDARTSERAARTATHDNALHLHKAGLDERLSEQRFIERLAAQLDQEVEQGKVRRLHIAADPKALGDFRQIASARLKAAIATETSKDYVHTPVKEIEAALSDELSG